MDNIDRDLIFSRDLVEDKIREFINEMEEMSDYNDNQAEEYEENSEMYIEHETASVAYHVAGQIMEMKLLQIIAIDKSMKLNEKPN